MSLIVFQENSEKTNDNGDQIHIRHQCFCSSQKFILSIPFLSGILGLALQVKSGFLSIKNVYDEICYTNDELKE